ncbi:MAG: hypothetical protein AB7V22_08860 [Kiritimatiellia bacterium]
MNVGPLLAIYLIGAAVLYLALRIFARARGHAGLSAATYLVLFSAAGLVAGGLFFAYVTRPIPPLRPVWAFAGTLVLVSLLQWGLGFLLVRRRIPRPGRAVAAAVLLMSALAGAICVHPLRMAEQKFAFFAQVDELQRLAPAVCAQWKQNEFRGRPDADLEALPDYLARQGYTGPIRPQDMKDHHPLLWTTRSAMPRHGIAILANGTVRILTDDERAALLARTVAELAAARNSP